MGFLAVALALGTLYTRAPALRDGLSLKRRSMHSTSLGAAAGALQSAAVLKHCAACAPAATTSSAQWGQLVLATDACASGSSAALESRDELRSFYRSSWYLQDHALVLRRAVQVAAAAHEGQQRKNGEPFIIHPLETATILAELKMDLDTIVAGLLHDTVEDTPLSLHEVESLFGSSVANIVKGDSKFSKLDVQAAALAPDARRELNHRNMLLAMGADWRVVIVKLADRLHNMRTLEFMPRHKQVRIARETIEIFVPLARRLGIDALEYELLHHSVSYLFPEELLGLFGLELLGHWARLRCWGVLDEFLLRDQVLSELDVKTQLSSHRERWMQHVNYWGVAFAK